jgi:hypothetical protein
LTEMFHTPSHGNGYTTGHIQIGGCYESADHNRECGCGRGFLG